MATELNSNRQSQVQLRKSLEEIEDLSVKSEL